jgi:hypothetical protein
MEAVTHAGKTPHHISLRLQATGASGVICLEAMRLKQSLEVGKIAYFARASASSRHHRIN